VVIDSRAGWHTSPDNRGIKTTLFPEALDEVIAADNEVRVVDAYVDSLDLAKLGFSKVEAAATGRPPYDPRDLASCTSTVI